ncbi:hypothetical protein [Streptomyces sp. SID2888]|uniref:hypothetical protein n=1 Tax=Streptomyces sp. SID2888 TaxID=2690256 RepID=UPI00235117D2|nr:hypothetical protein [Streptomyces sp. SID2888]
MVAESLLDKLINNRQVTTNGASHRPNKRTRGGATDNKQALHQEDMDQPGPGEFRDAGPGELRDHSHGQALELCRRLQSDLAGLEQDIASQASLPDTEPGTD